MEAVETKTTLLPVLETMDWTTLRHALAAAYGYELDERAAGSVAAEEVVAEGPNPKAVVAETEYLAIVAPAPEVTEYMEQAFVLAEGQTPAEIVQWIIFAPTFREARELLATFVSEGFILNERWYHEDLLSRWWKREIGLEPGKAEWLAVLDIKPQPHIALACDEEDAEVARQKLAQLLAPPPPEVSPEQPATPAKKPAGPATPFTVAAGQLVKEGEGRRKQKLAEKRLLEGEGRGRTRKPRYRESGSTDEEAIYTLQRAVKSWTPEMICWALYHAQVKIRGILISATIKDPLLSLEEKKQRIQGVRTDRVSAPLVMPQVGLQRTLAILRGQTPGDFVLFVPEVGTREEEELDLQIFLWKSKKSLPAQVVHIGPASPWPLWPNLQLVEEVLLPTYKLLGALRTRFREAEAWAEQQRGPAEQRGRVDMIDRDRATGPLWVVTDADCRAAAIFKAAQVALMPPALTGRKAQLAATRKLSEMAQNALAAFQRATDPEVKARLADEASYLIKLARKASAKLANRLPGTAAGDRRRKAAKLQHKAEAKRKLAAVSKPQRARKKGRVA